jgi:hypothetical protein
MAQCRWMDGGLAQIERQTGRCLKFSANRRRPKNTRRLAFTLRFRAKNGRTFGSVPFLFPAEYLNSASPIFLFLLYFHLLQHACGTRSPHHKVRAFCNSFHDGLWHPVNSMLDYLLILRIQRLLILSFSFIVMVNSLADKIFQVVSACWFTVHNCLLVLFLFAVTLHQLMWSLSVLAKGGYLCLPSTHREQYRQLVVTSLLCRFPLSCMNIVFLMR